MIIGTVLQINFVLPYTIRLFTETIFFTDLQGRSE